MKTQTELMANLKQVQDKLRPLADAGDDEARFKLALGEALYEYMAEGNLLTDLDWFKGTPYYTGASDTDILKAA